MKMKNLQKKKIKAYQVEKGDIIVLGGVKYEVTKNQTGYAGSHRRQLELYPVNEEECYATNVALIMPSLLPIIVWQPK